MAENANKPSIRFKGYTDAWGQRKLGEIGDFKNGMNFDKDAMGLGYPFVNLQDIFGKTIVNNDGLGLAESTEKQRKEYSLKKGDVLFIRSSVKPEGVGEAALVANDFPDTTYSGFIIRFRPSVTLNDQYKRFVFTTKSIRNQIMIKATSSANTNINQDSLGLVVLGIPKEEEQEKIGSFFHTLDDTITLHQRKLNGLRELKQGYLQQMFPQAGECVPRNRFAGFSGVWQERKLERVVNVNSGRDYKHLNSGEIPVYGTGGYMLSVDESLSEVDAIGIGRKGTIDKPQLLFAPFWTVDTLFFLTALQNNDLLFLYALSQCIKWAKMDESTGVPSLSKVNIEKVVVSVPEETEQIAIGRFFRNLDEQIAMQTHKLEQLKQLKTAYLQHMFV